MTTHPIVPRVLGPQAEKLVARDVALLRDLLGHLDDAAWRQPTRVGGASVLHVVEHLAEGAERLGLAWERRLEYEEPGPLLQPFDDPTREPYVDTVPDDPAAVLARYRRGTERLGHALATCRMEDWSWPVWSPLGGLETLAEASRRWLAHHYVHRDDVAHALGRATDRADDTVRLVVEFVLDAVARRGGTAVAPPMAFEVVTSVPGAGAWTLIFDEPAQRRDVESVWQELVGGQPESHEAHRVERGSGTGMRARASANGETVWRAAFGRGATWGDLDVHGDDRGKEAWWELIDEVARRVGEREALGRVQH